MILPWHNPDWRRIVDALVTIHHGILLQGLPGTGLREFSIELSRILLCEKPDYDAATWCDNCQNCRLFGAGTHPDFHLLSSERESTQSRIQLIKAYSNRYQDAKERDKKARPGRVIPVDQVRALTGHFSTHSHISSRRVALIIPADRLNINAANALLKLLEEPPAGTVFILATAQPSRLPATVISRCISVKLSTPSRQDSIDWLLQWLPDSECEQALWLADGAPVTAKALYESGELETRTRVLQGFHQIITGRLTPLQLTQQVMKLEFEDFLVWIQQFIVESVKWKETGSPPYWDKENGFGPLIVSTERLFGLYDRIGFYRRISRGNLNEQLAIEDLLLSLQRATV